MTVTGTHPFPKRLAGLPLEQGGSRRGRKRKRMLKNFHPSVMTRPISWVRSRETKHGSAGEEGPRRSQLQVCCQPPLRPRAGGFHNALTEGAWPQKRKTTNNPPPPTKPNQNIIHWTTSSLNSRKTCFAFSSWPAATHKAPHQNLKPGFPPSEFLRGSVSCDGRQPCRFGIVRILFT